MRKKTGGQTFSKGAAKFKAKGFAKPKQVVGLPKKRGK